MDPPQFHAWTFLHEPRTVTAALLAIMRIGEIEAVHRHVSQAGGCYRHGPVPLMPTGITRRAKWIWRARGGTSELIGELAGSLDGMEAWSVSIPASRSQSEPWRRGCSPCREVWDSVDPGMLPQNRRLWGATLPPNLPASQTTSKEDDTTCLDDGGRRSATPDWGTVDVAVVGGGPAGLAAALWAGRYRRRVMVLDGGQHRNDRAEGTHGFLAHEGVPPAELLEKARAGLENYANVEVRHGIKVDSVTRDEQKGFTLQLDNGDEIHALRLVLATGVRDLGPDIEQFDAFFGTSIFTCPSCDGYEAQGKSVVVLGGDADSATLAIGLLDWAKSIAVIAPADGDGLQDRALVDAGVKVVKGDPVAFLGDQGHLRAIRLATGEAVECDTVFCTTEHVQHSELAVNLGCVMSAENCVVVDDQCRTSVEHVFAAGDMTPGPHLVQVAASKGAIAGIAAATSLRGERGAPSSPPPAPDPDQLRNTD